MATEDMQPVINSTWRRLPTYTLYRYLLSKTKPLSKLCGKSTPPQRSVCEIFHIYKQQNQMMQQNLDRYIVFSDTMDSVCGSFTTLFFPGHTLYKITFAREGGRTKTNLIKEIFSGSFNI